MHDFVEKELLLLKKEYEKPQMSQAQFEELRAKMEEAKMADKKDKIKRIRTRAALTAAAFVGSFLLLPNTSPVIAHAMEQIPVLGKLIEVVTFRDYEYESDRNHADIEVPEIKVELGLPEDQTLENLERTTDEINREIKKITDSLIEEFETYLEEEEGYQDILVKSEILTATADYFTLKLLCYQGAGSGYQWNYYYTIDLNTGKRLQLKDVFAEGADYITPISEAIKEQMQAQMDADENVYYWLDDEIEEWNFKSVTDETSFYINENGNVVIGFNEGDVAPMYMGAVEFEIPGDVLNDIRK
ncbi:RsiV family protein [Sporofaciens musculi]|uniref:RsiV family protein n=1 Tax=Sporofaciens musculi TaxID=2681861 RepID=UPI00259C8182|nr:RsiV family protein [Sporofaciens musculi]